MRLRTAATALAAVVSALAASAPAGEPAPKPATPAPAVAGAAPAQPPPPRATDEADRPYLGIEIDPRTIDAKVTPGLLVQRVSPATTAASMGVQVGDRLLSLNGKPLAGMDDLRPILNASKLGDPVSIELMRGEQKLTLSGVMQGKPRVGGPATQAEIDRLNRLVQDLREQLSRRTKEPTLAEVLEQLKELEQAMPAAVERFKRQYPNGEFKIKIEIDIVSDKTAKNPVDLANPGAAKPPGDAPANERQPATPDAKKP